MHEGGELQDRGAGRVWPALLSGATGALAVTVLNEGVRRMVPHAPRMEVIGERALAGGLRSAGVEPPRGGDLYRASMAGDLLSNTLYYALVGLGVSSGASSRGAALGLAAGLGAVLLPRPLGLGRQPDERVPFTQVLTVAWYLAGGVAAGVVFRRLGRTR
ncbi:hypothetical protein [Deinococcus pimensis]|uniref:hypothetical protein n=1 Tax=Deinococcus pimensis TaxID=309888 RepID=UPI0004BA2712|nr:hypothetical protein [Deinococcus pimensis]